MIDELVGSRDWPIVVDDGGGVDSGDAVNIIRIIEVVGVVAVDNSGW